MLIKLIFGTFEVLLNIFYEIDYCIYYSVEIESNNSKTSIFDMKKHGFQFNTTNWK